MFTKKSAIIFSIIVAIVASFSIGSYFYRKTDKYRIKKAFGFNNKEYEVYIKVNNCGDVKDLDINDESTWDTSLKSCSLSQDELNIAKSIIRKIKMATLLG